MARRVKPSSCVKDLVSTNFDGEIVKACRGSFTNIIFKASKKKIEVK